MSILDKNTFSFGDVPKAFRDTVKSTLASREPIRWIGQPRVRQYIGDHLTPFVNGLTIMLITTIAVAALIARGDVADFVPLWAAFAWCGSFGAVGLALLCSPVYFAIRATKTLYLLTDRRAIVLVVGLRPSFKEYGPASLTKLVAQSREDGTGDLLFEWRYVTRRDPARYQNDWDEGSDSPRSRIKEEGFMCIPDFKRVEALARQMKAASGIQKA